MQFRAERLDAKRVSPAQHRGTLPPHAVRSWEYIVVTLAFSPLPTNDVRGRTE